MFGLTTENNASLKKTSSLYDQSLARDLVRTRPLLVQYAGRRLRAIAAYTLMSGDIASAGEVGTTRQKGQVLASVSVLAVGRREGRKPLLGDRGGERTMA